MTTYTFNDTKYTRWYYQLIDHRRQNPAPRGRYGETHHIIPESFFINRKREGRSGWLEGNPNARSNKVRLTGHEHALCHWLLTKMTTHDQRANDLMVYAFNMMDVSGDHMSRSTSAAIVRAYERNRELCAKNHSRIMKENYENGLEPWNKGLDMKNDPRCKGGKKNKGKKHSAESITQRITTMKANGNDKRSDETKALMSAWQAGVPKGPQSEEHRKAIADGVRGKPKAEGHGDNVAAAVIGNISINKDGKEKRVKEHQLQQFLDEGWARGGRPRKTKAKA
jgi:hypothetical protein